MSNAGGAFFRQAAWFREEESRKRRLSLVLTLGLVFLAFSLGQTQAGDADWLAGLDEGLEKAKAAGKPLLVDFSAPW